MKKSKILLLIICLVCCTCLIAGCGAVKEEKKDEQSNENKSVATVLTEQFQKEIENEKDLKKIAENISNNEILQISTDVTSLTKKDYLSGFTTEIKGFKEAVVIRPMIGAIPFIAYIFETENSEEFAKKLEENADLRWNVCTEADELKTVTVDNYVFFVMAPNNFEEQ